MECEVLEKLDEMDRVETKGILLEKPAKVGGLIGFLGLWDWFWQLPPIKQKEAVAIMAADGKLGGFDLFQREIRTLRPSFATYCWQTANKLMKHGFDELATGLLIKGLTIVDNKHDKEMLHIMYAKYFYRRRHRLKNAFEACINHCEKAVKSYEADKESRPKPVAPFKLMTMIYEETRRYKDILSVCDRAAAVYEGTEEAAKMEGFVKIRQILSQKLSASE